MTNSTQITVLAQEQSVLQMVATGGTSALTIAILYFCYKFLQSRHHLVSKCSSKGIELVADTSTPKQNPLALVDAKQESHNQGERSRSRERRCESPESRDRSRIHRSEESKSQPDKEEGKETSEGGVQERSDGTLSTCR